MDETKLPNITLSEDQEKAVNSVCEWYTDKDRTTRFCLAGLAGTGKSTIIPFVLHKVGLSKSNVHYCAYTGKASLVLQSKGLDATTIHKLIYDVIPQSDGSVEFELKSRLDPQLKLIVVDEASMVGKQMQEDLETFNVPVLYVGDHGQLPPVGDEFAKLMQTPDIRLERIHRQAEGNAIIKAAMMARTNGKLPHGKIGDTVVKVRNLTFPKDRLLSADQVLCGKNATRHKLNATIREALGFNFTKPPFASEKLICLRNDWNVGLVNGMIGTLEELGRLKTHNSRGYEHPHFSSCKFRDETGFLFKNVSMDANMFALKKTDKYSQDIQQFDFGYAITVHKSQGSQYNNLVVFEEWLGDQDFHRLWLYTAVTRAIDNLIIVQG